MDGIGMELRAAISFAEVAQTVDRSSDGQAVLIDAIGKVASGQNAPIIRRAQKLQASIS